MKILAAAHNIISDKFGYYKAVISYPGSRKCYSVELAINTNEVLGVLATYPSKKAAFAALGAQ